MVPFRRPAALAIVKQPLYSRWMRPDGWDQLDTARLILASIVAVGHAIEVFAIPFGLLPSLDIFAWSSEFAVLAFFVISGLVIGRSLIVSSKNGDWLFLGFMKRRFRRIYPPLLFSVVLTASAALVLRQFALDHYSGAAPEPARVSFSYLDNWYEIAKSLATFGFRGDLSASSNGPLWSLALEMQAYVVAGLVAQAIAARSKWVMAASVIAVPVMLRARGAQLPDFYHFACFGCFVCGIALSFLPIRFPRLIPNVSIDFSYSLYILHFPIMLFIFFTSCQGEAPSTGRLIWLMAISLVASVLISIGSAIVFERPYWLRARKIAATGAT
jgi:peptidoglycan/LPS O-acetylase OafA/YrhL